MATPEIRPYTLEELRGLVLAAKQHDDALRLTLYIWLALVGGLRQGEILRLTFLAALNTPEGIVVESTFSSRIVPRTPYALRMLLRLRATLMGRGDELLFGDHGRPPHRGYIQTHWFHALGIEPMALRRTGADLLHGAGSSLEEIAAHLGWRDLPPGFPAAPSPTPTRRRIEDTLQDLEQRLGFSL
jgi:integrase